jgi:uncharacterized ubiquitin-like protein YukD
MSTSARSTRRNAPKSAFFTRKTLFAAALVMASAIAGLAAFGPQSLSLTRLFAGAEAAAPSFKEVEPQLHTEAPAPMSMTTGSLATARSGHTATLLDDGRVLIVGGSGDTSAEIYDGGNVSATNNTNHARSGHTATRLSDGRVLIAGGGNIASEIFDPATGTFSLGPDMTAARTGHTATASGNNVIIIGGGTDSVEIYDSTNNSFTSAGSLTTSRTNHSAALMNDGRVFVAGGDGLDTAEIYNPGDGTSAATGNPLAHQRSKAHLRVLPDGKVQIIGGNTDVSMEVYDPAIDTIGAHVHLLPDTDTCTGLRTGVRDSQTRAALFFAGNADAAYDRTGHTITEISGNQALVIGGTTGGSAINSVTTFASSPATITTDKLDYAPGETVTFSGTGFAPGETVRVVIHEDPHTHLERNFEALADGSGNISGSYLVEEHDLNVKFIVNARGLTSNLTAQTAFTDSNPQQINVAAPISVTVTQGSTAIYGNLTVTKGGNNDPCTITLSSVAGGGTGLPAGATAVFGTNPLTMTNANVSTSLSVTTSGSTPTGTYTFRILGTNSGVGCQGPGPGSSVQLLTLIVNAGTVNTTTAVSPATATYGDPSVTLNATVTPASGPAVNSGSVTFTVKQGATTIGVATTDNTVVAGAASVNYSLPVGTNAGNYTVEAVYNAGSGFNTSSGSGTLNVAQRPVTVTADPKTKVYGEADPALTYQITSGSLVSGDAFTGALARAAGENVGTYAINQGTLTLGTNYNLSFVGANLTITERPVTVTADPQTKVYGEADPALTYQITSGSLAFSDSFSGALTRTPGEDVNAYIITQGTLALNANYALTFEDGIFEITTRPVQVTADPQTKVYGEADPPLTYQITSGSLAFSDSFTGALARAAGENVGSYGITQGTLSLGTNYDLTFVGANLVISARPIEVAADNKTKVYGENDPALTYQIADGSLAFSDAFTGALTRAAGEDVNTYVISQGTLALNTNYNLSFIEGVFEITARPIEVTADNKTKVYGEADPALTYQITDGSLAAGDSITGALTRAPGEDVNTYVISQGTLTINPNYNLSFVEGVFEITKAELTVTAEDKSRGYGDPNPALTYEITGFVSGDGPGDVSGSADCTTTAVAATPVADSPVAITCSGGTLAAVNYSFTFAPGELTITPATLSINAEPGSKVYGNPDPTFTYEIEGYKNGEDFTTAGVTGSAACVRTPATENVLGGPYTIVCSQGTLTAANYVFATGDDAVFTILQRPVTVTADPQTKVYGEVDPALTYQITSGSLAYSDAFTGSLTRVSGENVGSYAIQQGSLDLGPNYELTYVGANLAVTPRPVTVTADAQSKTYGESDPALTYQITLGNLIGSDAFSGSLVRVAGENVGTYAIQQGTLTLGTNYTLTYVGANLTITERPVTVTADPQTKVYGEADPALTYQITSGSLVSGDAFTGALARAAGENVGTYAINQGTLTLGTNYNLSFVGANLTITERPVTVTADPQTKVYGEADPALTYQITSGSLVSGDNFTGSLTRNAGEGVGSYAITQGTLAISTNYDLTFVGANLVISARPIEVTADNKTKIYGENDPALTYQITDGSLVFSDVFTGDLTRAPGEDVNTYVISQGTLALNSNYNLSFVPGGLEITARPIEVTADNKTKVYGEADPALTYQITDGSLVFSDGFTGDLTRAPGENVNTYVISQGTLALNANYSLTFVPGVFEITALEITVTPDAGQFKIYGDADPTLTYQFSPSPLPFSDTFLGSLERNAGETVGMYDITQGTLALSSNYTLTFTPGVQFEIKKKDASVTPNAASKTYGDPDPAFTGTLVGFLPADGVTATYTRVAGETVLGGPYTISATLAPVGVLSNYNITYNTANFTIDAKDASVTPNAASKTYGDPDPAFTGTLVGFLPVDGVTATYSRTSGETVLGSPYTISATLSPAGVLSNYDITYNTANFTIGKRTITVTPNSGQSKSFGQSDPVFTYTFTPSPLPFSDTFTGALSRDAGEFVGLYNITQGTLALNPDNYILVFTPNVKFEITTIYCFNGFHSPVGGSVENGNGGSFANPVRTFKLNSTIPFKFTLYNVGSCTGTPITTGVHTLRMIKYSNSTDSDTPIDATPTDAATTGNQFRLTGTDWHFNLDTKKTQGLSAGTWLAEATLQDGSKKTVWIAIKK